MKKYQSSPFLQQFYEDTFSRLRLLTDEELVSVFNHEVKNHSWTSTRGAFLKALKDSFLQRDFNVSVVITEESFALRDAVVLNDNGKLGIRE